jgi:glutaredoxin
MIVVEVYGAPDCVQCKYTVKKLAENGIEHRYYDVTVNSTARRVVEQTGKTQLPYVVAGDQSWHGMSPDRIKALRAS